MSWLGSGPARRVFKYCGSGRVAFGGVEAVLPSTMECPRRFPVTLVCTASRSYVQSLHLHTAQQCPQPPVSGPVRASPPQRRWGGVGWGGVGSGHPDPIP